MKRTPMKRTRPSQKPKEEGYADWKEVRRGECAVCRKRGPLLRHHVVLEQHVRREHGDPWDLDNSMDVGFFCDCHARHHSANGPKIKLTRLPDAAVAFAVKLFGRDRAVAYLQHHYAGYDPRMTNQPKGTE